MERIALLLQELIIQRLVLRLLGLLLHSASRKLRLTALQGSLLRTRVDIAREEQNQQLLAAMVEHRQLDAAWAAGARTVYCEFENPKHYREAVARFAAALRKDGVKLGDRVVEDGPVPAAHASFIVKSTTTPFSSAHVTSAIVPWPQAVE